MSSQQARLFAVIAGFVPQVVDLPELPSDVGLLQLGFDSMAIVSLFVELESEFDLSIEHMQRHLTKNCTVGSLLEMCCAA